MTPRRCGRGERGQGLTAGLCARVRACVNAGRAHVYGRGGAAQPRVGSRGEACSPRAAIAPGSAALGAHGPPHPRASPGVEAEAPRPQARPCGRFASLPPLATPSFGSQLEFAGGGCITRRTPRSTAAAPHPPALRADTHPSGGPVRVAARWGAAGGRPPPPGRGPPASARRLRAAAGGRGRAFPVLVPRGNQGPAPPPPPPAAPQRSPLAAAPLRPRTAAEGRRGVAAATSQPPSHLVPPSSYPSPRRARPPNRCGERREGAAEAVACREAAGRGARRGRSGAGGAGGGAGAPRKGPKKHKWELAADQAVVVLNAVRPAPI